MKRIVILGAGESGCGAAILAKKQGFEVFVSDSGEIKPQYLKMLDDNNIPYEQGQHTENLILNADEIIKSPGIPDNAPILNQPILADKSKIISEIEFAGRYTNAKMLCITGSNGKTTTTTLLYRILRNAGLNVGLAGNIGQSLALQVANGKHDYYVIELSSFQLDGMYRFKADVAILTNITPDHLDRYDFKFQNYINAKFRITQNQTKHDKFIFWQDDPVIQKELSQQDLGATLVPYNINTPLPVEDEEIGIQGKHNRLNATAATLAARSIGIADEVIARTLKEFKGVEHRLQYVDTINSVRFINDSKATNVDSCFYALDAMTTPVVLILGGKDKGNDYTQIDQLVLKKCHTLIFMGLHNEKLNEHFGHLFANRTDKHIVDTDNLQDAVRQAFEAAHDGDTVLLSPCCASFDLFKSYEDRGEQFMNEVKKLKA
ncbi:MAG: UDP-N-acetylmuramoyl-L-alanine--D-glutamate ligase [Paludibacteraceae bacterium]|nr:UDP-N-acetylmuramoyl-L-alanine--D-glutamate ligase [Paludibacteraceae bacterium]